MFDITNIIGYTIVMEAKLTLKQVAAILDVTRATVYNRYKEAGLLGDPDSIVKAAMQYHLNEYQRIRTRYIEEKAVAYSKELP